MIIINKDITLADESVILHQVNCYNAMGSGVAKALFTKWHNVKTSYHSYCEKFISVNLAPINLLGNIDIVQVEDNKFVVNCFSQLGYGNDGNKYTDYSAVSICFSKINRIFPTEKVAIPYLYGCGLGGGDWKVVLKLIKNYFDDRAVVYKLE